jgi:hypothetical protein
MVAPYWGSSSTGAINCSGHAYVTVDGGSNGAIANTSNGTGLADSASSFGIYFNRCPNSEIKNLTISNIYLNQGSATTATDTAGQTTGDIFLQGTSTNTLVHNNTLNNARTGVWVSFDSGGDASGLQIYSNTLSDHPWGISIGADYATSTAAGVVIHDNNFSNWSNWQFPTGTYHTDGIILFNDATPANSIATFTIYNNTFTGSLGHGSPTGYIACGTYTACTIFNNLMVDTGSYTCDGYLWMYANGGPDYIYNNTLVASSTASASIAITLMGSKVTVKNNVFTNVAVGIHDYDTLTADVVASDHNVWRTMTGTAPEFATSDSTWVALGSWQSSGYDTNSSTADPMLSAAYLPQKGSAAIGRGANLTTLGVSALNVDLAGTPRSGTLTCTPGVTGCWDAGTYNAGPAPPLTLVNSVQ